MNFEESLEKMILGKTLDEQLGNIPSHDHIVDSYIEQLRSNFPLREVGSTSEDPFNLSEEARASHIHILGTTREGKSKFLEMLLTQDMGNFGATLLDPSDNGQTAYNVLKWAIARGYEKVCLIDPHDQKFAIPCLNPLRWRGAPATDSVVQNIMESIRLLWGQTSFSDTPRIETYLSAVLTALYAAKATIPDAVCFLVKESRQYQYQRMRILDHLPVYDKSRQILEEVFNAKGQQLFLGEFKPSIRRLSPFFDYLPRLIYGSTDTTLDFHQLIADKWIILVNLDDTRLWGTAHQRVLGTLIINEIISAVSDLTEHNWHGRHYLYIDEAGQFATRGLSKIMAYKGKSGLWATVSHQYYSQFEDKVVLDAIENLCKIKVMFYTPNSQDRQRMIRDMYTGELKLTAGDAHASLKKQHAVIKIGKEPPQTVAIRDIITPDISAKVLGEWKEEKIYKANPWYRTAETIQEEIKQRFAVPTKPGGKAKADTPNESTPPTPVQSSGDTKPPADIGQPDDQPSSGTGNPEPKRSSVFDNLPDSGTVLRDKGGRPARKRPDGKTSAR